MDAVLAAPGWLGRAGLRWLGDGGRSARFLLAAAVGAVRRPFRLHLISEQVLFVGQRSLGVVVLTAAFAGLVLTLQGYNALVRFGSEIYLGPLVALSLVRELGPVLAALMVTARAGSSMAATIGGMRVTEQIDALEVMAVPPIPYLVSPRLVASILVMPLLAAIFDLTGIFVAKAYGEWVLGIDADLFMASVRAAVEWSDVRIGALKAVAFGALVAWRACYFGYCAEHGAKGVGQATTRAVVSTAVAILAVDYLMTALLS